LTFCNNCGNSLTSTEISYTDNIFMGFIYGIQSSSFPLKISIRKQTEDYIILDDLLALSPCHLNCIPTDVYVPNWLYLLTNPDVGLKLIDKLYDGLCEAAYVFWNNDE